VCRLRRQQHVWVDQNPQGPPRVGQAARAAVHDDLVQRNITAVRPNVLRVTHIKRHEAFS
jgi:hypothetical protein